MAVDLTLSETLAGSAIADSLRGSGSGWDIGTSETGDASPDEYPLFIRHNGSNKIYSAAINVQVYGGTYGGDYSAAADLTKILAHGDDGNGLQVDFRWDGSPLFASSQYSVFKNGSGNGGSFANRITLPVASMSRNNSGTEVDAGTPVAGEIGAAGDTTLGDRSHMTFRYVNPTGETANGYRQWDILISYNFTS
jgi:hypothetical protein